MQEPRQIQSVPSSPVLARNHICPTCNKPFQTASHLMRHARVHSTQRAHPCPFPGCQTRCSRKDNLQQHYRIHLSPGAKRRPGRVICVSKTPLPSVSPPQASPSPRDSPPLTPPPLADSRLYYLRIGAITKEQFDEMPVNLGSPRDVAPRTAETAGTQLDPNRWRQLPPLDTRLATRSLGSPVPLTSSMSAGALGASPYWSRSATSSAYSSAYTSPVGPYPAHQQLQQQLSPTLAQTSSVSAQSSSTYTYNYAEQHSVYPTETQQPSYSTEANVLAHADSFRRVVPSGNTLGLSTVQEPTTIVLEAALQPPLAAPAPPPPPPTLHAPHPVRVYMPLIEPEQEPTPIPAPPPPTATAAYSEPVTITTTEYDPGLYYPDPRVGLGRGAATPSTLASDSPETEYRYHHAIYQEAYAQSQSQPVHEGVEQYYQQPQLAETAPESSSYSPEQQQQQHSTPPAATPYAVYDPHGYYRIPSATASAGNSPTAHSHAHSPYSVRHHPYRRVVPYQAPQAQAVYGYEPPPTGPVYSESPQGQAQAQRRHSYPVQPVAAEYHGYSHYQAVS